MGDGGDVVAVEGVACVGEGTRISCSSTLLVTSVECESGGESTIDLSRCIGSKLLSVESARSEGGSWTAGEGDGEAGGIGTS